MRKKTIGEVLRLARLAKEWSLEQVQRMTNIQARHLQAIEDNDFEAIGDDDYIRLFIERYAEVVELDKDVLLDAYDKNSLIVYYDAGEEPDFEKTPRRNQVTRKKKQSFLPLLYLLLAATAILVFLAYIVSTRIQNQSRSQVEPSYSVVSNSSSTEQTQATTAPEAKEETPDNSQKATDKKETQMKTEGGGESLSVAISGASKPVEMTLSVTDVTSWISLTDTDIAGGVVLSPENPSVKVSIPEGVATTTLTLGVVKGVSIQINGTPLDTAALTSDTGYISFTIE